MFPFKYEHKRLEIEKEICIYTSVNYNYKINFIFYMCSLKLPTN